MRIKKTKKKKALKKMVGMSVGLCMILTLFSILLFADLWQKYSSQKNNDSGEFIVENSHTGLVDSPGAQIAIDNLDKNRPQYAANKSSTDIVLPGNNKIALDNTTPVIFDISAQPISDNASESNITLLIIYEFVIFSFIVFLVGLIYRKIRRRKIKLHVQKKN